MTTTIEAVTARLDRAGIPYRINRRWGPDDIRLLGVDDRVAVVLHPSRDDHGSVLICVRPARWCVRNSTIDRIRLDVCGMMRDAGVGVTGTINWRYGVQYG